MTFDRDRAGTWVRGPKLTGATVAPLAEPASNRIALGKQAG